MATTNILPRSVRVGDRILTTNGMREVLEVQRHPSLTEITVQDVAALTGRTVLQCFDYRKAKLTVERKAKP